MSGVRIVWHLADIATGTALGGEADMPDGRFIVR